MFVYFDFYFFSYNHLIDGTLNIFIVVFQAIVAVVCVEFCKRMKWVEYPPLTLETARNWAPMNIFFCLMLFTGIASLQYNSVPMVTIFKNITISFVGIFWMLLNCVATAGYVLYMKFATKHVKLSKFGMVYVNNVLCVVFLLPAAIIMGEVRMFRTTPAIHSLDYLFKNLFAGMVGFLLNFASLNCVATTGPTTYAIVGSVSKVPTAILGYVLFQSVITLQTWMFIAVSMAGGFLFSYAKLQSADQQQQPGAEPSKLSASVTSTTDDKEEDGSKDNDSGLQGLEIDRGEESSLPDADQDDHDDRRK
jgi:GDP-mannose transporter